MPLFVEVKQSYDDYVSFNIENVFRVVKPASSDVILELWPDNNPANKATLTFANEEAREIFYTSSVSSLRCKTDPAVT